MTPGPAGVPADPAGRHVVTLKYGVNGLAVIPPVLGVTKGARIAFALESLEPNASFRIVFAEKGLFSRDSYSPGDPDIVVTGRIPHRTTYACEFIVSGAVIARASGAQGGAVEDVQPI